MNLLHCLVVVGQVEQDAVPGNGCAALCCCELGWSTIFRLCKHLKNLALRVVVILCRDSEGPLAGLSSLRRGSVVAAKGHAARITAALLFLRCTTGVIFALVLSAAKGHAA